MTTLLITGINGVIGQIIRPQLSKKYQVYGIDSNGPFAKNSYPADISNFDQLASLQDNLPKIDCIIHLAAASHHEAPWETILKNNIIGARNIYELAHVSAVKRVVFASSTHPFGKLPNWPNIDFKKIPLATPFAPDSFYGVSKAFGEELAKVYQKEFSLNFTIIRIGSVTKDDTFRPPYEQIHFHHKDLIKAVEEGIEDPQPFKILWGVS